MKKGLKPKSIGILAIRDLGRSHTISCKTQHFIIVIKDLPWFLCVWCTLRGCSEKKQPITYGLTTLGAFLRLSTFIKCELPKTKKFVEQKMVKETTPFTIGSLWRVNWRWYWCFPSVWPNRKVITSKYLFASTYMVSLFARWKQEDRIFLQTVKHLPNGPKMYSSDVWKSRFTVNVSLTYRFISEYR